MSDLVIDIGGTKTLIAIYKNNESTPIVAKRIPTNSENGFYNFLSRLELEVSSLLPLSEIKSWGVSTAGVVSESGELIYSPNLDWKKIDLYAAMKTIFGDDGIVENDCNAAAYGEWIMRNGVPRSLVYITLSTGIGMGMVSKGKVIKGDNFGFGEAGHTIVEPGGIECTCGRRGCLQAYSGGKGMSNIVWSVTGENLNAEEIMKRAEKGEEPYLEIVRTAVKHIGVFVANVFTIMDTEEVVIGGGLSNNSYYSEKLINKVKELVYSFPGKKFIISRSLASPNPEQIGILNMARKLNNKKTISE